jgi:hypothetical protein
MIPNWTPVTTFRVHSIDSLVPFYLSMFGYGWRQYQLDTGSCSQSSEILGAVPTTSRQAGCGNACTDLEIVRDGVRQVNAPPVHEEPASCLFVRRANESSRPSAASVGGSIPLPHPAMARGYSLPRESPCPASRCPSTFPFLSNQAQGSRVPRAQSGVVTPAKVAESAGLRHPPTVRSWTSNSQEVKRSANGLEIGRSRETQFHCPRLLARGSRREGSQHAVPVPVNLLDLLHHCWVANKRAGFFCLKFSLADPALYSVHHPTLDENSNRASAAV